MTRRETSPLVVALVIVLGLIAPLLDTTIVNVAIPSLRQDLGATVATIRWVSTAYRLVTRPQPQRLGCGRVLGAGQLGLPTPVRMRLRR